MTIEWPGVLSEESQSARFVEDVNRLVDAAKVGNWGEVFGLLDSDKGLSANQWRLQGTTWFAPLHHAAWSGASVDVIRQLIRRGAWRSLRDADGERPVDIALKRGHDHLLDVLAVRDPDRNEQRKFAAWDRHLVDLVVQRTRELRAVRFRAMPTELIVLERLDDLWFAYPGMYGGFSLSIHKNRLFVESWFRVVGGSGQAHVITENGGVLVDEGFV